MGLILPLPPTIGGGCLLSSTSHPQSPLLRHPSPGLVDGEEGPHAGGVQALWNRPLSVVLGTPITWEGLEQSGPGLSSQRVIGTITYLHIYYMQSTSTVPGTQ